MNARNRRGRKGLVAVVLILGSTGCLPYLSPRVQRWQDPYDQPVAIAIDSLGLRWIPAPRGRHAKSGSSPARTPRTIAVDSLCKRHPLLTQLFLLNDGRPETLLVSFRDTVAIPRFPNPEMHMSRSSARNIAALEEAESLASRLVVRRQAQYLADTLSVKSVGGRILETYWLIQAAQIEIPRVQSKLDSLELSALVRRIEPRRIPRLPPKCWDTSHQTPGSADVLDGRQTLKSVDFSAVKADLGWVGLLDTGVRATHEMLTPPPGQPSQLSRVLDCVDGDVDCTGGRPEDQGEGHGTSSAAVITGFEKPIADYRGVTTAQVGSYRVWDRRGNTWLLDVCATVRAFQHSVLSLDRVIVVEVDDPDEVACDELGGIGDAAEHAFDTGVAVVAPVGNYGNGCTNPSTIKGCGVSIPSAPTKIGIPASARRVIGVGSYHLETGCCEVGQSWGTTDDGRLKPDVQFPTNVRTAGNKAAPSYDDDCAVRRFDGTSAATAFAGGAATVIRNLLDRMTPPRYDPGFVYALMILWGQESGPFPSAVQGAGRVVLQPKDGVRVEKIPLDVGMTYSLPIYVAPGSVALRAAIWWPEHAVFDAAGKVVDSHNNIDLHLIDPAGTRTSSNTVEGVFERLTVSPPVAGTWTLGLEAASILNGPQDVYLVVSTTRP